MIYDDLISRSTMEDEMVVYGTFRDKPDEDYMAVFDGRKLFQIFVSFFFSFFLKKKTFFVLVSKMVEVKRRQLLPKNYMNFSVNYLYISRFAVFIVFRFSFCTATHLEEAEFVNSPGAALRRAFESCQV